METYCDLIETCTYVLTTLNTERTRCGTKSSVQCGELYKVLVGNIY